MRNAYFSFKQFTIHHDRCAMKVTTDACLFGAWVAERIPKTTIETRRVLDIGAGTGLLGLMLLQKNPNLLVTGIEIDKEAAAQAMENAGASPWKNAIQVLQGDAGDTTCCPAEKFDIVISNPPFYEKELHSPDPIRNIAHHSGGLSLEALFRTIRTVLTETGIFYVLLPFKRAEEIKQLIAAEGLGINHITQVRHSAAHPSTRIFIAGQPGTTTSCTTEELIIHTAQGGYTDTFSQLLKDYYLHL